jgi:hypothetical protein
VLNPAREGGTFANGFRLGSRSAAAPWFDVTQLRHHLFVPFSPLEILRGQQHLPPGHVHRGLV